MDEYPNNKDILDIDELVKAAQSELAGSEVSNIDPHQIEVREFIRERMLKPGKVYIPLELIYYHYSEWSPAPLTRHKFSLIFSQYFTKKKIMGYPAYRLDPECIGLPSYYTMYRDPTFGKDQRKFNCAYEGVYGVSGYFIARIELEDGKHYLGRFKTAREAAIEYDKSALYHLGSMTKLNFPEKIKDYEQEAKETQE